MVTASSSAARISPVRPYSRGGLSGVEVDATLRFTESAATTDNPTLSTPQFREWFDERRASNTFEVHHIPFDTMDGWHFDGDSGNLVHRSGKFFAIEGLQVTTDYGPIPQWQQPIINQPEVGILGIVVKEIDGVLHCLMQSKMEPGNVGMVQLSPTVQATRSNYTRVHQGAPIKYLEYFVQPRRSRVLVDVLQSEQGAWFLQKRNRNIVVEVTEDIPLDDEFCWLTLGQIQELLTVDNLVNMDARTVLSCIPFVGPETTPAGRLRRDPFRTALVRSLDTDDEGALHTTGEILSWFTESKTRYERVTSRIPLKDVAGWRQDAMEISHEEGKHFTVMGVSVEATNREVARWHQPLVAPQSDGIAAFLTRRIDGVLHVLVHARVEAGYLDVTEMAPSVQCMPDNYAGLPPEAHPPFLDLVLSARPEQIRYEALQSEEGGRFYRAENRYLVVDVQDEVPVEVPDDYMWVTVRQITNLLRHSHYLNVQARSLVACLQCLW